MLAFSVVMIFSAAAPIMRNSETIPYANPSHLLRWNRGDRTERARSAMQGRITILESTKIVCAGFHLIESPLKMRTVAQTSFHDSFLGDFRRLASPYATRDLAIPVLI